MFSVHNTNALSIYYCSHTFGRLYTAFENGFLKPTLGKPQKKSWGKGQAIKEKKNFFWNFFFIFLPLKNKNYFTLDNLSKYGHITLKFVGRYFYLVVTIFSKK